MIEMTAITASPGAKAQSWHQDGPTAPSRFGRGFRAGYSVFIQLQNTTKAMGATGACPGLYMCSETPEYVCEENGLQPVNEKGYWRAGDALLMNMDSTHRGSAHVDPDALDRVMFIMTFVAKPRSRAESRQIIQGITFSLRWDMWGHTWQDLEHADTEMIQPWATLRALGLYKKPNAVWGVDYITSACERIPKEDFGFFREHLDDFVSFGGFKFIPQWLQGQVGDGDDDEDSWPEFLLETLERCEAFMEDISFQFAICYVVLFFSISMAFGGPGLRGRLNRFGWALLRLGVIGCVVLTMYRAAVKHVDESDWAYDIRNNLKYTSPFGSEEAAYDGAESLPNRKDVLIETRYKSEYLALYNDYIKNHPGNRLWNELVDEKAEAYASYGGLPSIFREAVAEFIVGAVHEEEGRFLYQSPNARWVVLSDDDAKTQTKFELVVKSNPLKLKLVKELEFLISEVKYNELRKTAMSAGMLPYLLNLKTRLATGTPHPKQNITIVREGSTQTSSSSDRRLHRHGSALPIPQMTIRSVRRPVVLHVGEPPEEPETGAWLQTGDFAEVGFREGKKTYWYKAQILDVLSTGVCHVYFVGEDYDEGLPCSSLRPFIPPTVGDRVQLNSDGRYLTATILREKGNELYDIEIAGVLYEDVDGDLFRHR